MSKRKSKILSEQQTKNEFTSSLIIPLLSVIIGIIVSIALSTTIIDGVLVSLCLSTYSSILMLLYNFISSSNKIVKNQEYNRSKVDELVILSQIQERLNANKHPYFKKWGQKKILAFLDENEEFFNGVHKTYPHAEDTYGVEGLKYTNSFGTIKCTSLVPDYWDDEFTNEYLNYQKYLVENRGVKIQRIFFIKKSDFEKMKSLFDYQHKMGIEVFYLYLENEYINKQWIEDFLIQDDKLLVQIFCNHHKFDENSHKSELITTNQRLVEQKIETFSRLLERATKFSLK